MSVLKHDVQIEIRRLIATVCRYKVIEMGNMEVGQQRILLQKLYCGGPIQDDSTANDDTDDTDPDNAAATTTNYPSHVQLFLEGTDEFFANSFETTANNQRALKCILHRQDGKNFVVDKALTYEALCARTKDSMEQVKSESLHENVMEMVLNLRLAMDYANEYLDQHAEDSRDIEDYAKYVLQKMFVRLKGRVSLKMANRTDDSVSVGDMRSNYAFAGFMTLLMYGPFPLSGISIDLLSLDRKNTKNAPTLRRSTFAVLKEPIKTTATAVPASALRKAPPRVGVAGTTATPMAIAGAGALPTAHQALNPPFSNNINDNPPLDQKYQIAYLEHSVASCERRALETTGEQLLKRQEHLLKQKELLLQEGQLLGVTDDLKKQVQGINEKLEKINKDLEVHQNHMSNFKRQKIRSMESLLSSNGATTSTTWVAPRQVATTNVAAGRNGRAQSAVANAISALQNDDTSSNEQSDDN